MAQGLYKSTPIKQAGLSAGVIKGAVSGLAGSAGGIIGGGKRRDEQRKAQAEMERNKARYSNLDTSNLAANLENVYEDLTVNQGAANFAREQSQQNMANVMSNMGGAAGGSGIAAMAQALAGQGNQQAQQAAASIGQQESANQMATARGAAAVQTAELAGAQEARNLEKQKVSTLLGMSQQRLGAANQARAQATQSLVGGVGSLLGAGADHLENNQML